MPEVFVVGLLSLAGGTAFVASIRRRRAPAAFVALVTAIALSIYPFFGGLTSEGRRTLWFGPLLGIAALIVGRRERVAAVPNATE